MWRLSGFWCEDSEHCTCEKLGAIYSVPCSWHTEVIQPSTCQSNETFDKFRSVKMPALPQFDYLFAIGTIFAFLDAWNIGKYLLLIIMVAESLLVLT